MTLTVLEFGACCHGFGEEGESLGCLLGLLALLLRLENNGSGSFGDTAHRQKALGWFEESYCEDAEDDGRDA